MDLMKIKKGTKLVAKGNGERLKVKGFKVVEHSPQDKEVYITVKPYSGDYFGQRNEYDITTWTAETYYEIEEPL